MNTKAVSLYTVGSSPDAAQVFTFWHEAGRWDKHCKHLSDENPLEAQRCRPCLEGPRSIKQ